MNNTYGTGFNPGGMPGTTGNTAALGDATSLESTYQMTKADLRTPIFIDGQTKTVADVIQWFQSLPPNQVLEWERAMVEAGFESASSVGDPQARVDAFNSLLRFTTYAQHQEAGGTKLDLVEILRQEAAANPGAALNKRGLPNAAAGVKLSVDLSNPLDVKQLGDKVAQQLVGRDLTPQEAVAITGSIRAEEMSSAQGKLGEEQSLLKAQQAAATGQGGGGTSGLITTMAPTSAEAATTQYLTQHDAGDVQAHSLLNVFEAIKQKVETDAQGSGPRAATGPMKVI